MTGNELRIAIKRSGVKAVDIIRVAGIPEQTLYGQFHKTEVDQHYIDKIKLVSENLRKSIENVEAGEVSENTLSAKEVYELKIKVLEQELAIMKHEKRLEAIEKILKNKSGTFTKKE